MQNTAHGSRGIGHPRVVDLKFRVRRFVEHEQRWLLLSSLLRASCYQLARNDPS